MSDQEKADKLREELLNDNPKNEDDKMPSDFSSNSNELSKEARKSKTSNMDSALSKITNSKFNKYVNETSVDDFTAGENHRNYVMQGKYCEDGYQIATSGMFLTKLKEDYPIEDEGKIIKTEKHLERQRKYRGDEGYNDKYIEGQFPSYKRVIPEESNCKEVSINTDDLLKRCMVANSIKGKNDMLRIKVGDAIYNTEMFSKCLAIAKQRGMKFYQSKEDGDKKASMFMNDKGECCVIMPLSSETINIDEDGNISNLTAEQENKLSGGEKETTKIKLDKIDTIETNFFNKGAKDIMNFFHEKRGFEPIKTMVSKRKNSISPVHNYSRVIMNPEHINNSEDYAQAMNDLKDLFQEYQNMKKNDLEEMRGSESFEPAKGRHSTEYKKLFEDGIQNIKDKYGIKKSLDDFESLQKSFDFEYDSPDIYALRKSIREILRDVYFTRGYSA